MTKTAKVIMGTVLATVFSGHALALECLNIHAPTGVIDIDSSATPTHSVSYADISLKSPGKLTIRYPLAGIEQFNGLNAIVSDVGFTDSYSDGNVKVELITQRVQPVYNRYTRIYTVSTVRKTLFDSVNKGNSNGYRLQGHGVYVPDLDSEDNVYSLEVTLVKTNSFPRYPYTGSGIKINNISVCPHRVDG